MGGPRLAFCTPPTRSGLCKTPMRSSLCFLRRTKFCATDTTTTNLKPNASSNRDVCAVLFRAMEDRAFSCSSCSKTLRSRNGYTNLMTHLRRHHPDFQAAAAATIRSTNALRLSIVDQRTADIYRWIDSIVMDRLPFSFCERPLTRINSKLSSVSRGTLTQYMEGLQAYVEESIKRLLPKTFGLVLDGWTDAGRFYVATFAVFYDPTAAGTGTTGSRDDYYDDIDCPGRRYVLLAFSPLDEEDDLSAQSVFDMMADTLSRYDRPWSMPPSWSLTTALSTRASAGGLERCLWLGVPATAST